MTGMVKILSILILISIVSSCSKGGPTQLHFQSEQFDLIDREKSSAGDFSILEYSNDKNTLFLIVPDEKTDLGEFSSLYTASYKLQGYSFSSRGNNHLGESENNIVYLTVSPGLEALSVFLVEKGSGHPTEYSAAASIFLALEQLQ